MRLLPRASDPARRWLLVIAALAVCTARSACAEIPEPVTDWLRAEAHVLESIAPSPNTSDLQFLHEAIGDARLISCGEATHGTSEFQSFRHRLFRFLVEEMGFTVLGLECGAAEVAAMDRYIRTGLGASNAEEAASLSGSWVFATQEMADLLRWMREYNASASEDAQLRLIGFDMQSPFAAIDHVVDYVRSALAGPATARTDPLVCLMQYDYHPWQYKEQALAATGGEPVPSTPCGRAIQSLLDWFDASRQQLIDATSHWEFAQAANCLRTVLQGEQFMTRFDLSEAIYERDQFMADNVLHVLDELGPGARAMLWSHNSHAAEDDGYGFGEHLVEALGEDVVTILSTFLQGESLTYGGCKAEPATKFPPPPSRSSCYEAAFATTALSRFVVDFRDLDCGSAAGRWLCYLRDMRAVGAMSSPVPVGRGQGFWSTAHLPSRADLLLYVQDASAPVQLTADIPARADRPVHPTLANQGFESGTDGWILIGASPQDYAFATTTETVWSGNAACSLGSLPETTRGAISIQQAVSPDTYAGHRVRVSVQLKAEAVSGWTALWYEVGTPSEILSLAAYRDLEEVALTGTTGWTRHEFELDVRSYDPPLFIGVVLYGSGTVYIDDFGIEILDH